ncbi:hypothetical protein H9P43_009175 [Blastocladiella emersonii ATCC 22665]|nr:hypothetical protein H9P43_009175 [Blastocladiella emersonii ATCC 22665]
MHSPPTLPATAVAQSASWYTWAVSATASLGGFLFGYEIGIINSVLEMDPFKLFFGLSTLAADGALVTTGEATARISRLVSFFLLGCIPGAILVSFVADRAGRKRTMWLGALFFTIGSVLQAVIPAGPLDHVHARIAWFMAGRFLSGIGVGILSMAVPLYIAELAPTRIRGRLTTVQQLMITIGIAFAPSVNALLIESYKNEPLDNDRQWRIALGVQAVPGFLLMFMLFLLPESPRWLMAVDREDEALHNLAKLRQAEARSPAVQEEFHDYKQALETERQIGSASWRELLRPGIKNRLVIVSFLQFFQQWTGINVVMYYSASFYIALGNDKTTATTINVVVQALVNVFGTLPGMYLIERVGRVKLLTWGGIVMAVCNWALVLFVNLFQSASGFPTGSIPVDAELPPAARTYSTLSLLFLYLFVLAFSCTWAGSVWVYQSEVFPARIRGKGTGLATLSNWTWNYVIAATWPYVSDALGPQQYAIFGVTGLAMAAFAHYFVPETMGRSLEDMDSVFGFEPSPEHGVDLKA